MKKLLFLSLILFSFIFTSQVFAADPNLPIRDEGYSAKFVLQSIPDPIEIPAGTSKTVIFKFKNVGTKTWRAGGANFVSAYTVEPKYHDSLFRGANWLGADQTATVSTDIYSGQTGELKIDLIAPNKTGEYIEKFYLAVENYSWVKGSYFYIKIKVTDPPKVATPTTVLPSATIPATEKALTYDAKRFLANTTAITAKGGEPVKLILGYQNLGESTWQKYSVVLGDVVSIAGLSGVSVADSGWQARNVVVTKNIQVNQWDTVKETFYLRTPSQAGEYKVVLNLAVDDGIMEKAKTEIKITVTENAPSYYEPPTFSGEEIFSDRPRLEKEPTIRVGLWKDPGAVEFISDSDNYNVYRGSFPVGVLPLNTLANLSYSAGVYSFSGGGLSFSGSEYIRLEPANDKSAIFTLRNYERQVSWKGTKNFNSYRGSAELRAVEDKSAVYLINEPLFEDYVAGIAETSNSAPIEYIKALLTAARTYAYYIQNQSGKHDARNFDVVATTGDQLYLGYLNEVLSPRVVEAGKATRGYVITYGGLEVITPYFGNSDGRTRSWTEVWGGTAKPWLVSVKATYDLRDGKTMYGHGVGMSQRDAAVRAEEEGVDWQSLVKYYYTGVEVEKYYN